jgi:hypothetical protein
LGGKNYGLESDDVANGRSTAELKVSQIRRTQVALFGARLEISVYKDMRSGQCSSQGSFFFVSPLRVTLRVMQLSLFNLREEQNKHTAIEKAEGGGCQ